MMWINIGVIVLLTLRVVMFRLKLPTLLDAKNDNSLLADGDEQQERLSVGDGEVNEHSPRKSSSGNSATSQLHIHVMPGSKVRW
jgi:hypothetical protein